MPLFYLIIMRYVYGPVKSRRLGLSLGLSVVGYKTCNLDCIYCQLGKTKAKMIQREEYIPIDEIMDELKEFLRQEDNNPVLDYITLSGFGEPTLNIKVSQLIDNIKGITSIPVAVLTNSVLLVNKDMRKELLNADLICPSLDAVDQETFNKVNRPYGDARIKDIIEGLRLLRAEFSGKIFLEIMLIKDLNDSLKQAEQFAGVIKLIDPDKIQLNIPVRYAAEDNIKPPDMNRLKQIKHMIGKKCEII